MRSGDLLYAREEPPAQPLLSVLIPTLEERSHLFARVTGQLRDQIRLHGFEDDVEIVSLLDRGEVIVGTKRNELVRRAKGEYIAFVDDDDRVSDDYLPLICKALRENPAADCVGIRGVINFRGGHPREFVHSLRYREYRTERGKYLRPPYHLNPVRRSIALRYPFAAVSYSEDIDWAMRLCRDRALRSEAFVDSLIYYYDSRRYWTYQWLVDLSEPVRHPLGLQISNRLELYRSLRRLWPWGTRSADV